MTLFSNFALNTVFTVESFSVDARVLRHDCFEIDGVMHRCSPRSVFSGDIRLKCRYSSGFAGEVVSYESAVVENTSFLFRSLYLPYEVPHALALHIEIYTASRGFLAIARLLLLYHSFKLDNWMRFEIAMFWYFHTPDFS